MRFGIIILTLLCAPIVGFASPEKIAEAEVLYQSGDWEKAQTAYAEILAGTQAENLPPAFFYNFGTTALRTNNGAAYAYLLKAFAAKPWDGNTRHNLDLAETKLSASARVIQPASWLASWPLAAHFAPSGIWLLPALLVSAGLWWALGATTIDRNQLYAWLAGFAFAAALALVGYQQTNAPAGVLLKTTQVKSGPGATFPIIMALEPGATVNTEELREGYKKIRFLGPDAQEAVGWIEAGALLELR